MEQQFRDVLVGSDLETVKQYRGVKYAFRFHSFTVKQSSKSFQLK